jgi:hypothetical protein
MPHISQMCSQFDDDFDWFIGAVSVPFFEKCNLPRNEQRKLAFDEIANIEAD